MLGESLHDPRQPCRRGFLVIVEEGNNTASRHLLRRVPRGVDTCRGLIQIVYLRTTAILCQGLNDRFRVVFRAVIDDNDFEAGRLEVLVERTRSARSSDAARSRVTIAMVAATDLSISLIRCRLSSGAARYE